MRATALVSTGSASTRIEYCATVKCSLVCLDQPCRFVAADSTGRGVDPSDSGCLHIRAQGLIELIAGDDTLLAALCTVIAPGHHPRGRRRSGCDRSAQSCRFESGDRARGQALDRRRALQCHDRDLISQTGETQGSGGTSRPTTHHDDIGAAAVRGCGAAPGSGWGAAAGSGWGRGWGRRGHSRIGIRGAQAVCSASSRSSRRSCSRIRNFCTLPVTVRGNWSTKCTRLGTL